MKTLSNAALFVCWLAAVIVVAVSVPERSSAVHGNAVDDLRRAITTLEARVKQLESRPACPCARSATTTPAPRKPVTVWIPPRQTRDEDDYTPGRYEVRVDR